jgi:ABC-type polysaccharide/polyol phosphate transport system ATPase subunit
MAEPGGTAVSDDPYPIKANDIRLAYRLARNRAGTFKEFTINLLRRQLVYEEFWALDDVSFEVRRGEVFGVVGPNGAGKSTLMKVLAGVLPPTSGRVVIRGVVSPMIEVSGGINPEMTGRENIVLLGTLLGREPAEMRERTAEIAEWAGLTDFLNVPVASYSTGMRARLSFAVATDIKPDVLLVDEVLAVGDEAFRKTSLERIEDLMDGGTSVVLVSHSLSTVTRYADTAMWLDHGRVKAMGPANEVVDAYRGAV